MLCSGTEQIMRALSQAIVSRNAGRSFQVYYNAQVPDTGLTCSGVTTVCAIDGGHRASRGSSRSCEAFGVSRTARSALTC